MTVILMTIGFIVLSISVLSVAYEKARERTLAMQAQFQKLLDPPSNDKVVLSYFLAVVPTVIVGLAYLGLVLLGSVCGGFYYFVLFLVLGFIGVTYFFCHIYFEGPDNTWTVLTFSNVFWGVKSQGMGLKPLFAEIRPLMVNGRKEEHINKSERELLINNLRIEVSPPENILGTVNISVNIKVMWRVVDPVRAVYRVQDILGPVRDETISYIRNMGRILNSSNFQHEIDPLLDKRADMGHISSLLPSIISTGSIAEQMEYFAKKLQELGVDVKTIQVLDLILPPEITQANAYLASTQAEVARFRSLQGAINPTTLGGMDISSLVASFLVFAQKLSK